MCFWQIEYGHSEGMALPWLSYKWLWLLVSGLSLFLLWWIKLHVGETHMVRNWRCALWPTAREELNPTNNHICELRSGSVSSQTSRWDPSPGQCLICSLIRDQAKLRIQLSQAWFPMNRNYEIINNKCVFIRPLSFRVIHYTIRGNQ